MPSQSKAIRSKRRGETRDMAVPSEINKARPSGHEAGEFGGKLGVQFHALARSRMVEL
ncbi:hypothetical protein D3C72_2568360 [compost metagenome]